eukprot:5192389-Pleurochrysis_carterae.AAC.1
MNETDYQNPTATPAHSAQSIDDALEGKSHLPADVAQLLQRSRFMRLGVEADALLSDVDDSSSDDEYYSHPPKCTSTGSTRGAASASSPAGQPPAGKRSQFSVADEVQYLLRNVHRTRLRAERFWVEKGASEVCLPNPYPFTPVSYTHLTLPTILLV